MIKKLAPIGVATVFGVLNSPAASLTIEGNGLTSLLDRNGSLLTDGSIVQVGYFLGVSTSTDPEFFSAADWDTFTALTGPNSLNPGVTDATLSQSSFNSVYSLGRFTLDDSTGDVLPNSGDFPFRLGVRIFDTTDPGQIGTADFNTVTGRLNERWVETGIQSDPPPPPRNLGYAAGGVGANPDIFWQFDANPFQTVPIPEPGTSLTFLLGTLLVAGRRRRG
jgi:hypothetical protein